MGEKLTNEFGAEVGLISGSGGIFDVYVDGKIIFSKKKLKRFPREGEIAELLRK